MFSQLLQALKLRKCFISLYIYSFVSVLCKLSSVVTGNEKDKALKVNVPEEKSKLVIAPKPSKEFQVKSKVKSQKRGCYLSKEKSMTFRRSNPSKDVPKSKVERCIVHQQQSENAKTVNLISKNNLINPVVAPDQRTQLPNLGKNLLCCF